MKSIIIHVWLPIAIASTIIMMTVYAVAQQSLRQSANDPQIQLAEDGAATLSAGYSPYSLVGNTKIDIGSSLAPFVIIYDGSGQAVASTGYLNGEIPILPQGVFEYVKTHTDDRITWQPASATRLAAVVKRYNGKNSGFIVAARSLRETEIRENFVELATGLALLALLVITFVVCFIGYVYRASKDKVS